MNNEYSSDKAPTKSPSSNPPQLPSTQQPQYTFSRQNTAPKTDPDYAALEEKSFSQLLNSLLKKPLSIVYELNHSPKGVFGFLCLVSLVCLAVFGIVLGLFSAGHQLWAAPIKIIGGIFFSGLICLPSLYIFGALGGMNAKLTGVAGLMLTFIAITSLLLVGFAPVIWLFSTSSNSLVFFGFLSLTIWLICLIFGLRVVSKSSLCMGGNSGGHLAIWAIIFTAVTLQMTTTLRPIIGESKTGSFLNLEEKRFFLHYWFEVMGKNQDN